MEDDKSFGSNKVVFSDPIDIEKLDEWTNDEFCKQCCKACILSLKFVKNQTKEFCMELLERIHKENDTAKYVLFTNSYELIRDQDLSNEISRKHDSLMMKERTNALDSIRDDMFNETIRRKMAQGYTKDQAIMAAQDMLDRWE